MGLSNWNQARNLLCIRLDSLGDVLMTAPALRALRESVPGRRLTLLTSPAGASVARLLPDVDAVMLYEAPWLKSSAVRTRSDSDHAMAAALRAQRFDGAIIFTVYSQNPLPSALLCYLSDIPLRLAYCRENPYQLLTHWVSETEPQSQIRHEVRRQLDLVAHMGSEARNDRVNLRIPNAARSHVANLLMRACVDRDRPWVVVHPGASAASRRYPPEKFAAAARRLVVEDGFQLVFTGSGDEAHLVAQIQKEMNAPSHSFAGRLNVAGLAALLTIAPLLISNNTGPVHVACAVGTPVVDLYALTNPQHIPWDVPHRVLNKDVPCKYCYKSVCPEGHNACLHEVSPDSVVAAVRELLAETSEPAIPAAERA